MRLLLDTHVLVWLVEGRQELAPRHRAIIDQAASGEALTVSAISFWEIAMLERTRRLALSRPPSDWRRAALELPGVVEIPVRGDIAVEAVALPGSLHSDPADRLIVATARLEGATLVTRDERLLGYSAAGHVPSLGV